MDTNEIMDVIQGSMDDITIKIKNRNTIGLDDYHRFMPIFNNSLIIKSPETQPTETQGLIVEFQTRFSLFDPISVIDDDGNLIQTIEAVSTITDFVSEIENDIYSTQCMTEHEFITEYHKMYSATSNMSPVERERIADKYHGRFSLFHPIRVVNNLNETVLILSAPMIRPKTINDIKGVCVADYKSALDMSNPLIRHDLQMAGTIEDAIRRSIDTDAIREFVHMRQLIEQQPAFAHLNKPETPATTEATVGKDGSIKIDTTSMFQ